MVRTGREFQQKVHFRKRNTKKLQKILLTKERNVRRKCKVSLLEIKEKDMFFYLEKSVNNTIVDSINQRLAIHNIKLTEKEITQFDPKWKLSKNDVGVSWFRK